MNDVPNTDIMNARARTDSIKRQALVLGFDDCRIASVRDEKDDGFGAWLAREHHAGMAWMARSRDLRQQVALKVPGARSVVVLAKNYYRPDMTMAPGAAKIARYAWRRDYHRALARPLRHLSAHMLSLDPGAQSYASTDSGPVRERAWAARAGMGWIGRNGLVIHKDFGTWFYLATIITTTLFKADETVPQRCGACTACMDACPTGAIVAERDVDARRCISYHTIENKAEMPVSVSDHLQGWVFGCDICQEACPWNRKAELHVADEEGYRPEFAGLDMQHLAALSEAEFEALFNGTPVRRAQWSGLRRNAQRALDNQEERAQRSAGK